MTAATRQPAGSAAAPYGRASHHHVPIGREPIWVSAESIRPGMDIYDYDGVHVGRVKDVHEATFVVRRRWHDDLSVPVEQVLAVLDGRVVLTIPRGEVGAAGRD